MSQFNELRTRRDEASVPFLKGIIPPMSYDVMAPFEFDFSHGITF